MDRRKAQRKLNNMGYKNSKSDTVKSSIAPGSDTPPNHIYKGEEVAPGPPHDGEYTVQELTAHLEAAGRDHEEAIAANREANSTQSHEPLSKSGKSSTPGTASATMFSNNPTNQDGKVWGDNVGVNPLDSESKKPSATETKSNSWKLNR
jgi:hypothetical protein